MGQLIHWVNPPKSSPHLDGISFFFVAHEGEYLAISEQVMLHDLLSVARSGGSIKELALRYEEHQKDLLVVEQELSAGVVASHLVGGLIWMESSLVPSGGVFAVQIGIKLPSFL
jgi:hypothetical protein